MCNVNSYNSYDFFCSKPKYVNYLNLRTLVSQVIVPCYYCVPDQHFSAMGNCEESSGRKKDCPFFQIKVEQFNISTSGI